MPIYVIDAYALASVGDAVAEQNLNRVLHELTDLVKAGTLRYPDAVWRECCAYSDEHGMGLWSKATAGHLPTDGSDWGHEERVLNAVPNLVDADSVENQTQVDVAKMATWLVEIGQEVFVVTDDLYDRPDRQDLGSACAGIGLEAIAATKFLDDVITFAYA